MGKAWKDADKLEETAEKTRSSDWHSSAIAAEI